MIEFNGTCKPFEDGNPCDHPGCLSHVTHPCEGCGRIAGKTPAMTPERLAEILEEIHVRYLSQGYSSKGVR